MVDMFVDTHRSMLANEERLCQSKSKWYVCAAYFDLKFGKNTQFAVGCHRNCNNEVDGGRTGESNARANGCTGEVSRLSVMPIREDTVNGQKLHWTTDATIFSTSGLIITFLYTDEGNVGFKGEAKWSITARHAV